MARDAPPVPYWSDLRHHSWADLWTNYPAVRAAINRRVTGRSDLWPIAWLPTAVPDRIPFGTAVSIGCGVGNLERSLAELRLVGRVIGVDASAGAIAEARRAAAEAGRSGVIEYTVADAREFLARSRDLDAVFFHASLHHFDRLDELLGLVRRALKPRGILYLDEYVGPARDEWSWRDLLRWNLLYRSLPAAIRRTHVIRRPINRQDPTEAIASSGILPAVQEHFRILGRRDYGGNLLAVMYPSLLRPDQPGGPQADVFDRVIDALLAREDRLLAAGAAAFHTVLAAEPKPDGGRSS